MIRAECEGTDPVTSMAKKAIERTPTPTLSRKNPREVAQTRRNGINRPGSASSTPLASVSDGARFTQTAWSAQASRRGAAGEGETGRDGHVERVDPGSHRDPDPPRGRAERAGREPGALCAQQQRNPLLGAEEE